MERLRGFLGIFGSERKAGFALDNETLTKAAQRLIDAAVVDQDLRDKILFLAGLPLNSRSEFYTAKSGLYKEGGVDVLVGEGASSRTAFTLGFGQDKITFLNKLALNDEGKWICKMKPKIEIGSLDELTETVEKFVRLEPFKEEIIDVGKKDLKKK